MLKRDISYDLFSREVQTLDELFSRDNSHLDHLKPAKPDVRPYERTRTLVVTLPIGRPPPPPPPPPPSPPPNRT